MPTDDEIRIILNVLNAEKVEAARKAIEQEEEAIRQLGAQLQAGAVSQAQFDAAAARSAQAIIGATNQIKSASRGLNPQAFLEISRAIEDFSFAGLQGVVNNIPSIVQSLGGGPGLAGAASLLAVGLNLATRNWENLTAAFGQSKTLSESAQMDELAKSTKLAADQADRLTRYKAIGAKSEEIRTGKTEAQQATESAATKAIVEAGAEDVARGLLKANPAAFDAAIPGITDDKNNLLQNHKGENRTAATDVRDAAEALADYLSGKSRQESRADRAGGSYTSPIDPAELQRLQTAKAEAEKALAEARQEAATDALSKGALPKYFPGGTDQLREKIEANPDAFGPRGAQLAAALRDAADPEAAKLAEDDRAARADEINAAEKRRLDAEVKYADEEEKAEAEAQKLLDAQEKHYQDQLAKWAYEGDQKIRDEDVGADAQDRFAAWQKEYHRAHQSSQVMNLAGLRDAIQTSSRDDANPTARQQLDAQREAVSAVQRSNELLQQIERRVGGPARAG